MTQDTTTPASNVPAEAQEFMAGGLRERLGLEAETLQVGRTIAEGHLRRGAVQEAMKMYGALALCEPTDVEVQLGIAQCATLLQVYDLGVGAATAAAALAPDEPRAQMLLAQSRLALGDRDSADRALQECLRLGLARRDGRIVELARRLLAVGGEPSLQATSA